MCKKAFKSLLLTFLCIFTVSCGFVSENTGFISFSLPGETTELNTRVAEGNRDSAMRYRITIKSKRQGPNTYSYDKQHNAGIVKIDRIPIGHYSIFIEDNQKEYRMLGNKAVDFIVRSSTQTTVEIFLEKIDNVKPNPNPDPEIKPNPDEKPDPEVKPNPDEGKLGTLNISFTNNFTETESPRLRVEIYDANSDKIISEYTNSPVYKGGCNIDSMRVGEYKLNITGASETFNYSYDVANSEIFKVTGNSVTEAKVELITTPIEKPQPENNRGKLSIIFSNGLPMGTFTDLTVKIYGETSNNKFELKDTRTNIDAAFGTDVELPFGKYKIEVLSSKYEYLLVNSAIFIIDKVDGCEANIRLNEKVVTPGNQIKPDPSKGIYCVNGDNGKDSNPDGTKYFKTVSAALKMNSPKVIYVEGNVSENSVIKLPKGIILEAQPNKKATITNSGSIQLDDGGIATINGIEIINKNTANDSFAIKMPDSTLLSLGKDTVIKTENTNGIAISLGSQGTLTLSNPNNIAASNKVKVLNGAKLAVKDGFTSYSGEVILDFSGNGDNPRQLITAENNNEIQKASTMFKIVGNPFTIDQNGKLVTDSGSGGGEPEQKVIDIWDYSNMQNTVSKGGTFGLPQKMQFGGTVRITNDVTFVIKTDITLTRQSGVKVPFFIVEDTGSLTIKRVANTNTGTITFDGNNVDGVESLIVANGNITLENTVLTKNNNTALTIEGNVIANLKDTTITGNTSVGNGGGISMKGANGFIPELTLSGNTVISKNTAPTHKHGGGIYVNSGWLTLKDNAKVTSDNKADTNYGNSVYFQSIDANTKLNGTKPCKQIYDEEVTSSTK